MNRSSLVFATFLGCFAAGGAWWQLQAAPPTRLVPIATTQPPGAQGTFATEVAPVVDKFCIRCHGPQKQIASVDLSGAKDAAGVGKARDLWLRAAKMVESKHMPPEGLPAPTQAQRDRMVKWLRATLAQNAASAQAQTASVDCDLNLPGRVTMRRLNREEYNNTVRDLLGVDFRPADDFPSDDVGYGFDNIGDVLSISPLLMEKYLDAAEQIADKAISLPQFRRLRKSASELAFYPGSNVQGANNDGGTLFMYAATDAGFEYTFPAKGTYTLRVRAYEQHAGDEPARLEYRLSAQPRGSAVVSATRNAPQVYEQKVFVDKPGKQWVTVAFVNDFYDEKLPEPVRDRNVSVEWFELEGPYEDATRELPPAQAQIIFVSPQEIAASPDAAARKVLTRLAQRAYRRPARPEDVERLLAAYKLAARYNDSFERGIQLALQAALVSPRFLFRLETDSTQATRDLDDYELASRLAYFLWSSMPDQQLMALAAQKKLRDPQVLQEQALRMLGDTKARALAENFASQWLTLRNLNNVAPDTTKFPDFDDKMRNAMRRETLLFFLDVVRNDRSVLEFLDGKWTYVNADLARHYGIQGDFGDKFQRVQFTGATARQRGGVLTQASVLTVTSNPTRTSPVKRGKWVLEELWGTPPPPPPPGVPSLKETPTGAKPASVRAQMELHRKNPECASCHTRMDAIGFSLENYDAVGRWRDRDGTLPIDTSGSLSATEKFVGPEQFKAILMQRKAQFVRALSEKMLTYALGRGLTEADSCFVDDLARRMTTKGYKFSELIGGVVSSTPFRKQGVEGLAKPADQGPAPATRQKAAVSKSVLNKKSTKTPTENNSRASGGAR